MTDLLAGLRDDPATAMIGCAAIIPCAVWSIVVIGWMIMGEIDILAGIVAIMVAGLLGMVAMWPSDPIHAPLAVIALLSLMVLFPIARRQIDARALVAIDVEQIEGAYEMLAAKPDNASAMFKLAEKLYARGMVAHAIAIGERALANMPHDLFPQENRAVGLWRRTAGANNPQPVPCLSCSHRNPTEAVFCQQCGDPYLAAYARGKWLGPKLAVRLVASWVAATVALVGIPYTVTAVDDPVMVTALILVQLGIAGVLLWKAFLAKESKS